MAPDWVADDVDAVLAELEKRPPNRQLLSPVIGGYIAGLLQASGDIGYLQLSENPVIYTPFIRLRSDAETLEFVVRQIGDAWRSGKTSMQSIYILGLRAIILLKIVGPFLRSFKKTAYQVVVKYGYKLDAVQVRGLARRHGLGRRFSKVVIGDRIFKEIVFRGK